MRKHELVELLKTLDNSADRLFSAWLLEQALQLREPLFFGNLPETSKLIHADFVSMEEWTFASRVSLSRGKHGMEVSYYPYTLRLGPKGNDRVVTARYVLEDQEFRDLLQVAELRQPGGRMYG